MSKGLKALEKLTNYKCSRMSEKIECKEIIEQELKEAEMEHTLRIRLENINHDLVEENKQLKKELEALEIIKKRKVNVNWLKNDLKDYNNTAALYGLPRLTQEEYDLLKKIA